MREEGQTRGIVYAQCLDCRTSRRDGGGALRIRSSWETGDHGRMHSMFRTRRSKGLTRLEIAVRERCRSRIARYDLATGRKRDVSET